MGHQVGHLRDVEPRCDRAKHFNGGLVPRQPVLLFRVRVHQGHGDEREPSRNRSVQFALPEDDQVHPEHVRMISLPILML